MEPKTRCHFMFLGSGNCLFSAAEIVTVCVFTFRHSSSWKSEVTLFPLLKFMLLYSLNFSLAEVTEVPALPAHCWLSLSISPSPGLPGPGHRCRPAPGQLPTRSCVNIYWKIIRDWNSIILEPEWRETPWTPPPSAPLPLEFYTLVLETT